MTDDDARAARKRAKTCRALLTQARLELDTLRADIDGRFGWLDALDPTAPADPALPLKAAEDNLRSLVGLLAALRGTP